MSKINAYLKFKKGIFEQKKEKIILFLIENNPNKFNFLTIE